MNFQHHVESDNPDHSHPVIKVPPTVHSALIPLPLPPAAYYIPAFITPAEETLLLQHINDAPRPTWKILSHRRLQAYPSVLSNTNTLLEAPLPSWLAEPIILRLLGLCLVNRTVENREVGEEKQVSTEENLFTGSPHGRPNHCLVNEYLPGQGIYPHEDGGAYWPIVCTVSLGSHAVLEIMPKRSSDDEAGALGKIKKWRILQEPRSLLISTGEVYTGCLHGIAGVNVDENLGAEGVVNWDLIGNKEAFEEGRKRRDIRVSLTFRDVLKVKTLGKAFGGLRR